MPSLFEEEVKRESFGDKMSARRLSLPCLSRLKSLSWVIATTLFDGFLPRFNGFVRDNPEA